MSLPAILDNISSEAILTNPHECTTAQVYTTRTNRFLREGSRADALAP